MDITHNMAPLQENPIDPSILEPQEMQPPLFPASQTPISHRILLANPQSSQTPTSLPPIHLNEASPSPAAVYPSIEPSPAPSTAPSWVATRSEWSPSVAPSISGESSRFPSRRPGGGKKVTRDEETILINTCVSLKEMYGKTGLVKWWTAVGETFASQTNRKSYGHKAARERVEGLVKGHREALIIEESGYEGEGDDHYQALSHWNEFITEVEQKAAAEAEVNKEVTRSLQQAASARNEICCNLNKRSRRKIDIEELMAEDNEPEDEDDQQASASTTPSRQQSKTPKKSPNPQTKKRKTNMDSDSFDDMCNAVTLMANAFAQAEEPSDWQDEALRIQQDIKMADEARDVKLEEKMDSLKAEISRDIDEKLDAKLVLKIHSL